MRIDSPYRLDGRGRTASTGEEDYVRDLIEEVLFTAPGERVNRPTFGSTLRALVFAPASEAVAAAAQFAVQAALQQWLAELVVVEGVEIESEDAKVRVTVRYVLRSTQERHVANLTGRAG